MRARTGARCGRTARAAGGTARSGAHAAVLAQSSAPGDLQREVADGDPEDLAGEEHERLLERRRAPEDVDRDAEHVRERHRVRDDLERAGEERERRDLPGEDELDAIEERAHRAHARDPECRGRDDPAEEETDRRSKDEARDEQGVVPGLALEARAEGDRREREDGDERGDREELPDDVVHDGATGSSPLKMRSTASSMGGSSTDRSASRSPRSPTSRAVRSATFSRGTRSVTRPSSRATIAP